MIDWLQARVKTSPTTLALIYETISLTYHELNTLVNQMVQVLTTKGMKKGEHIAVLLPNSLEYIILIHALVRLGTILIPLNIRLTSTELSFQLQHTNPTYLIYSSDTQTTVKVLPQLSCTNLLIEDITHSMSNSIQVYNELSEIELDNIHCIIFTSGSTNKPKGVTLSYKNHFWGAMASAYQIGTFVNDRWLLCMPLYHIGGLSIVFRCCLYGTCIILHQRFNTKFVLQSIQKNRATLISLVPTMLKRLLDDEEFSFPNSLRLVLLGGDATPQSLVERCKLVDLPIATTYGMTETTSQAATALPEKVYEKKITVGKPLLFISIRIFNEKGTDALPGEIGEIAVQGPTVMHGYYNLPDVNTYVFRNNYFMTGDLGYFDKEGDLFVVQRRNDLIVSGGENVYPSEVEKVLLNHPDIVDACVVGVPDEQWGQKVAAAVVLKENSAISTAIIANFCRKSLAGYKIPKILKVVNTLPYTPSGKIIRYKVKEFF